MKCGGLQDLIAEHRALSRRTQLSDPERARLHKLRNLLGNAVKDDIISPDQWAEIVDEIPTSPELPSNIRGGDDNDA